MNQFHFRTNPACHWPYLPPTEATLLWTAYQQLVQSQWLPAEEIERGQMQQLRFLWRHCLQNCPYYQSVDCRPEELQSLQDLSKLPLLTRESLRDHGQLIRATQLPPGVIKTGFAQSAGTTGTPIKIQQTNIVNLWWFAYYLRDLEWCGVDPSGRLASIRAFTRKGKEHLRMMAGQQLPYWSKTLNTLIETGPSFGMDVHQDPRHQLEWLRQVEPDYFLTNTSNLQMLGSLIKESGRPISSIKSILLTGEAVPPEIRADMESVFEAPLKDTYSCSEAGYLASPCPSGRCLHVHAENVILEVLDDEGRPCGPGQTGRVVLTTLQNLQTPLVRYAINDGATIAAQSCDCGRQLLCLSAIDGKERPFFTLPDGRRKNSAGLVVALRDCEFIHQHQIVQNNRDEVLIRAVPNGSWTDRSADQIRETVQAYFESPVQVSIESGERIAPAPGGKLLNVIVQGN